MAANPHAEKAKELLVHHIREAGGSGDPQEIESIVDEILAAVHLEIGNELKAVFSSIGEGRKAAQQLQKDRPA